MDVGRKKKKKGKQVESDEESDSPSSPTVPLTFRSAVLNSDVNRVSTLLAEGKIDPDYVFPDGSTALHIAATQGSLECLRLLIFKTNQINHKDSDFLRPLHKAVINNQPECVRMLIKDGNAKVDARDAIGRSPLHWASILKADPPTCAQILIEAGADVNATTDKGLTVLHMAAKSADLALLKLLIAKGAQIDTQSAIGNTALHFAVAASHVEGASYLLEQGANPNSANHSAILPLHKAVEVGSLQCTILLIVHKADINAQDHLQQTPLFIAVDKGDEKCVSILLRADNVNPDTPNVHGKTPIYEAAKKGHVTILSSLLRANAGLTQRTMRGNTALHAAAKYERMDALRLLLKQESCNVNILGRDGKTALHIAAANGNSEISSILVEERKGNIVVDALDNEKSTPFLTACESGSLSCVKYLHETAGARAGAVDREKRNAFHRAAGSTGKGRGCTKILRYLLELVKHHQSNEDGSPHSGKSGKSREGEKEKEKEKETEKEKEVNDKMSPKKILPELDARTSAGDTVLHCAIKAGCYECVRLLIEEGMDINLEARGSKGEKVSCLHLAALCDLPEIAKLLIAAGADTMAQGPGGMTPVQWAEKRYNYEVMSVILGTDKGLDSSDEQGRTPLHRAVASSNVPCIRILVDKGSNANLPDAAGHVPLHTAVMLGNSQAEEIVSLLLYSGAHIDETAKNGDTALHLAVRQQNLQIAKLLIENGADLNKENLEGRTPLHTAATLNSLAIATLLVSKGAKVNVRDKAGNTPLLLAAEEDRTKDAGMEELGVFYYFLMKTASDALLANKDGKLPLHYAASRGEVNFVDELLERGTRVNHRTVEGETALHMAAQAGSIPLIKTLLNEGAILSARTKKGLTPLHMAAAAGQYDVAKYLISLDADSVQTRSAEGMTPLHYACLNGHRDCADLLLDNQADMDALDNENETPLHKVARCGSTECAILLVTCGAKVNVISRDGSLPLHIATKNAHAEVAGLLLSNDSKKSTQDSNGMTPLHYARDLNSFTALMERDVPLKRDKLGRTPLHLSAGRGNKQMVFMLLDREKVDVNGRTKKGYTPLHYAMIGGNKMCVRALINKGADVNAAATDGSTPLHLCAMHGAGLVGQRGEEDGKDNEGGVANAELLFIGGEKQKLLAQSNSKERQRKDSMENSSEGSPRWMVGLNVNPVDSEGNTPLHFAVSYKNKDIIPLLIERGALVNQKNKRGDTPLHLAAALGALDCVMALLHVTKYVKKDSSKIRVMKQKVEQQGSRQSGSKRKKGSEEEAEEQQEMFLDNEPNDLLGAMQHCNLVATSKTGQTALHLAAYHGHVNCLRLLLMIPELDVNLRNPLTGETPLHSALQGYKNSSNSSCFECAKELISKKADLSTQDLSGETVLHLAATSTEVLTYLFAFRWVADEPGAGPRLELENISRKALIEDLRTRNSRGLLPMQLALTRYEALEMMLRFWQKQMRLKEKRQLDKRDIGEDADFKGKGKGKEKERDTHSNNNDVDKEQETEALLRTVPYATLLHWAAGAKGGANSLRTLRDIIDQVKFGGKGTIIRARGVIVGAIGVWLNKRDEAGRTPLHWAVASDNAEKVDLLVKEGADVNATIQNPEGLKDALQGSTAIHLAARWGLLNVLNILLEAPSINLELVDSKGNTPMHCAVEGGNTACVEALFFRGVNLTCEDNQGNNLLHKAAAKGSCDSLQMLLNRGAIPINKKNREGRAPVHLAVTNGRLDALKLLDQHHAEFRSLTEEGKTCAELAEEFDQSEVLVWLRDNIQMEMSESESEEEEKARGKHRKEKKRKEKGTKKDKKKKKERKDTGKGGGEEEKKTGGKKRSKTKA